MPVFVACRLYRFVSWQPYRSVTVVSVVSVGTVVSVVTVGVHKACLFVVSVSEKRRLFLCEKVAFAALVRVRYSVRE